MFSATNGSVQWDMQSDQLSVGECLYGRATVAREDLARARQWHSEGRVPL